MTTQIVNLNVTQQVGPSPNNLQKTAMIVSLGATTLSAGSTHLITQPSDLTPILRGALTPTSVTWASDVVTMNFASAHGVPNGVTIPAVLAGFSPSNLNGSSIDVTATNSTTLTFPLTGGGSVTTIGTFEPENATEVVSAVTTFFDQGMLASIYVLELGILDAAGGVSALSAYLTAVPAIPAYVYLVPSVFGPAASFAALAKNYESASSMLYFAVPCDGAISDLAGVKSVILMQQTPADYSTENDAAAFVYEIVSMAPSAANLVPPFAFRFVSGVTALAPPSSTAATLKAANVNYIDTGAEGGISNTLIRWGVTQDGRDFSYWYAADWMQIQAKLMLANAIINGSNNPQAPLYYNQAGINTLRAVAQGVVNTGVAFGLVNGNPQVQAVPFSTYTAQNPSDYKAGIYNGLSLTFTPNRGFDQITFNITVSDFPTA